MILQVITSSQTRSQTMIATGPRIDPHKLYTHEELEALLPASLLRMIIPKTVSINGLFSGRQVGSMVQDVFEAASGREEKSASSCSASRMKAYLTVTQVAEVLNSSPREVTRLVDAGKLRALDLNEGMGKKKRALRFRREWIEQLEAVMTVQPEEKPKTRFRFKQRSLGQQR